LGRACTFAVNGTVLPGVRDVAVRRTTNEVDATGYGHAAQSRVVIHRSYEIDVQVIDATDAGILSTAAANESVVAVTTTNGLMPLSKNFTVHETTADESLDDAVVATFVLRQWEHGA
jgi:hypothetical protein